MPDDLDRWPCGCTVKPMRTVRVTPSNSEVIDERGQPIRPLSRRLRDKVASQASRAAMWVEDRRLGMPLRWTLAGIAAVIPMAQGFALIDSALWLVPWSLAALALVPLEHFRHRAPLRQLLRSVGSVNSSFGGSITSLTAKLSGTQGPLTEDGCQGTCAALLHRIRDYAAFALDAASGRPRLRATLAVPIIPPGSSKADELRVWAYDEPHGDRGFTRLPLYIYGEPAVGAPAAYLTGALQIIEDIRTVGGRAAPGASERQYRSILSIPLATKAADGLPLAVVSLDADEPNFFEVESVLDRVLPLIDPVLSTIGLALRLRQHGVPYAFPD